MLSSIFLLFLIFRKPINLKTENRDHGLLFMVIDQCIVQTMIKMIVHITKQSLGLVSHYSIGKYIITMIDKEKYKLLKKY